MPWSENNKQLHQQSVKDSHMAQAVTMTTSEVEERLIREIGRKGTSGFGGKGQALLALSSLLCFLRDQEAGLPFALQVLLIF